MKKFTQKEARRIDQLIAIHVFGYRWYYFPGAKKTRSKVLGVPDEPAREAYNTLLQPGKWIARHGGKEVKEPKPNVRIDVDIPEYHKDEDYLARLCEKYLQRFPMKALVLSMMDDGGFTFECGVGPRHRYPTIVNALADFIVREFSLGKYFTYEQTPTKNT